MDLDQITVTALTVAMEAAGESYEGKLGVAYVISNRARNDNKSLSDICLQPYQFSCWNTDSPTRTNLDQIEEETMAECLKAVLDAWYELVDDPTNGADHYLNLAVCDPPPSWYDPDAVTATIGNHTFLQVA